MSSRSAALSPQKAFHCGVCLYTITPESFVLRVAVADQSVCLPCFVEGVHPLFVAALHRESAYPAKYGPHKLVITHFTNLVPPELIRAYEKKSKEYDTQPAQRVYCICSGPDKIFLGKSTIEETLSQCERCGDVCCLKCRKRISSLDLSAHAPIHACQSYVEKMELVLPEETRGIDWQKCPGRESKPCGALVELNSGCNQMDCPLAACEASFCYLCGSPAVDGDGHWTKPNPCSRYNHPAGQRAWWDGDAEDPDAEFEEESYYDNYEEDYDVEDRYDF